VLNPEVRVVSTLDDLQSLLAAVPDGTRVAADIETDQLAWYSRAGKPRDSILLLALCWDVDFGVVLDDVMLYDVLGVVDCLQAFFDRTYVVTQNGKFDAVFLKAHLGLWLPNQFDVMVADYIFDESLPHGLKAIAQRELGISDYEEDLIRGYLTSRNDFYSKIPFDKLSKYACFDVAVTLALSRTYEDRLKAADLFEWPFQKVLVRGQNALAKIQLRGIRVDVEWLQKTAVDMEQQMDQHLQACWKIAGREVNLNSPVQVAEVVYDQLRFPESKNGRIPPRSTSHDALSKYVGQHPFIDELFKYRRISKLKSSYVDNLLEFVDNQGRIHADFKVTGTEVGRLAVVDPALQTIPRASDPFGAAVRGAFIAGEGRVLIVADYSQAELRVAAVLSQEPLLLAAYREGRDLHSEVAASMFGPNYTKEQRVMTKMFNFSYLYGGSEYSFAQDAGLPIETARAFVQQYNRTMPRLAAFRDEQFEKLVLNGFVSTVFGRRRHFSVINDMNVDEARKAAVHMPVAGTASDLTLISAMDAQDEGIEVVLMVHDSVLAEAPIERAEEIGNRLREIMESTGSKYLPEVPWKVDVEIGERWVPLPNS